MKTNNKILPVIITKRSKISELDSTKSTFLYNFKHNVDTKNPWDWDNVNEEHLSELIRAASLFEK